MRAPIGRLHVLTDFTFQQRFSHAEIARMAIEGGADCIQFRQKHGTLRDILQNASEVAAVCKGSEVPLLVNDRVDVALAVGAAGVHLGQTDMPITDARRVLGTEAIIGITTPSISLGLAAQNAGADYVGFGPVYPTRSKANPTSVKGLEGVLAMSNALDIPVIAIAGITRSRAADVVRAGAWGVAVMTAISLAEEPTRETAAFRSAIEGLSTKN